MKCSWAAERSLSSEARHLAMKSPGVMAFGSSVGMVVSWVSFVSPAGGVIIRCVESCACRECRAAALGAYKGHPYGGRWCLM